jgi:transmembrane sensor
VDAGEFDMGEDQTRHQRIVQEASDWISRIENSERGCRRAFAAWVAQDEAHRRAVRELIRVSSGLRTLTNPAWERALQCGRERTAGVPVDPHPVNGRSGRYLRPHVHRTRTVVMMAANVLVCALAVLFLWQEPHSEVYTTGPTEWRPIRLVDGSVIKLNSHSTIRVHYTPEVREIELVEGEAFFAVAHDAQRPFKVEANGIWARALGTEFDVRLEDGGDVALIVKQGRVGVASQRGQFAGTELHHAQFAVLHFEGDRDVMYLGQLSGSELRSALAWGDWLIFRGESLQEVAARFNAADGMDRLVIDDAGAAGARIGGTFRANDIPSFAQVLSTVFHLDVTGPNDLGVFHVSQEQASRSGHTPASPRLDAVPESGRSR